MQHKHGVFDSDTRFSINPITRQIRNDSNRKIVLIQNDHKSEIFTFECPRTVEGHDMSLCNEVEVHFLNIASDKRKENSGFTTLKDFRVDPEDESKVVCSWEIDINATRLAGSLNFLLFFKCKENDVITYGWHTAIYEGIFIAKGINADESFEQDYVDVIERWKAKVMAHFTAELAEWKATTAAEVREEAFKDIATERKRIDLLSTYVTPQMFGAKGDGVTDDTEAIQTALEYVQDNGGQLYFPAGTYLVSSTLYAKNKVRSLNVFGCGMDTIIRTSDDFVGDYVFWVEVLTTNHRSLWVKDFSLDITTDASGFYFKEIGMKSIIENLWIKNSCLDNAVTRSAIYCDSATVTTFTRIKVAGFSSGCGIVIKDMHSSKIIDCDITFCKHAIYLSGGSNNRVSDCRIDENEYGVFQNSSTDIEQDTTVHDFNGTFKNLMINGNRFEHNMKCAIFLISFGNGYLQNSQITIAENYFTSLTARARAIYLGRCDGVTIDSNYFKGDAFDNSSTTKYQQNISIVGNVSSVTIADNVADEWVKDGETIRSNPYMAQELCNSLGFVNDIEKNQSSRKSLTVHFEALKSISGKGTVDVSTGNTFVLADGTQISEITVNETDVFFCQEITLVADGAATVKHGSFIKLKDGVDFTMNTYDTLTLVRIWVSNGIRWVEKCRSIVSA